MFCPQNLSAITIAVDEALCNEGLHPLLHSSNSLNYQAVARRDETTPSYPVRAAPVTRIQYSKPYFYLDAANHSTLFYLFNHQPYGLLVW